MKRLALALCVFALILASSVPSSAQFQMNFVLPLQGDSIIFDQVFRYIKDNYIYNFDLKKCRYELLKNLSPLAAAAAKDEKKTPCLDRHSAFHTPDEVKAMKEEQTGHFGGIGAEIEMKDKEVAVRRPMEGGPAERAGLKAGDVIIKVRDEKDAEWTWPKDTTEAVKKIRGPVGTAVFIVIKLPSAEIEFRIFREDIKMKFVESKVFGDIGYAHYKSFTETSADQLEDNFRALRQRGINKVILDLRNDPGGLLPGALETLFYFSKKDGDIMLTTRYKKHEIVDTIGNSKGKYVDPKTNAPKNPGEFADMKVVVLVNGRSASASEITSGTLQDWGYTIIGENTYKKGVGQTVFPLADGSGLRLTTFEFLTGNGKRKVNDVGIKPDIEVKWEKRPGQKDEEFMKEYADSFGDPAKDPQLQKALEVIGKM